MDETVELGGNIQLTGFKQVEPAAMVVLKKIIGGYAKKFSERCDKFEKLGLTLKPVHKNEHSEKYELHGMVVDNGKTHTTEVVDRNLFFALSIVLKKLDSETLGKE